MRRSRAAACLLLLGALFLGPGPSGAASTPERWRLSAAPVDGPRQVVEVLANAEGVIAFRTGARRKDAADQVAWDLPSGDAVALDGAWWTLARPVQPVASREPDPARLAPLGVEVVDATTGDPDGDGTDEVVVVFRRTFRETVVSGLLPDVAGTDDAGRSLHLGLYDADLTQEWVAGTVFRPVSAVAACDGALALAFASSVAATDRVAAGASLWGGFGFTSLPDVPDLPGPGDPACADVDGDGRTEPVVINRKGRTSP
ncbi:MAG: hypothetical protein ACQERF_04865 [Actinomycetota bacterium]